MPLDLSSPREEPKLSTPRNPDDPLYPDIVVQLTGESSNAGAIMGSVTDALHHAGVSWNLVHQFREECMSGNYEELLQTVQRWVSVT